MGDWLSNDRLPLHCLRYQLLGFEGRVEVPRFGKSVLGKGCSVCSSRENLF